MTQNPGESEVKPVRFPKIIKHRNAEVTIFGSSKSYPAYRLAWRANGKRQMKRFETYGEAKAEADKKVRELSEGNQVLALTEKEITAAIAIRDAVETYRRETGQSLSPLHAVTQYLHAAKLLGDRTLNEAVDGYLKTVAVVQQKKLGEAVEEFIKGRASKAKVKEPGKRSALNPKYVENTASWLREFASTFPCHNVCNLSKEHLGVYIGAFEDLSAKSRNDRRAVVKQFFRWCVRNDYLSTSHRLLEADALVKEASDSAAIGFYRSNELRSILEGAEGAMRVVIALQALAGLRLQEALRIDWSEVFGIVGHVEITSGKSKTRSRRLIEICPALAQWLEPYRGLQGKVAEQWPTLNSYVRDFAELREVLKIPSRRNGLRHGFCSFHLSLHSNENLTAALAGNSPAMLHKSYKGLATKSEADEWFKVAPAPVDNLVPLATSRKA